MVAALVPFVDSRRSLCLAMPMLRSAHDAFDRGNMIEAGCKLREAIDRYLNFLIDLYAVKHKKQSAGHLTPKHKIKLLRAAGGLTDLGAEWLTEIIGYCNTLAHCGTICRSLMECCIGLAYRVLDDGRFSRQGGEA